MWTRFEEERLKELGLSPSRYTRDKLVAAVQHFQKGGSVYSVVHKGIPVLLAAETARKVRELVRQYEMDFISPVQGPNPGVMSDIGGAGQSTGLKVPDLYHSRLVGPLREPRPVRLLRLIEEICSCTYNPYLDHPSFCREPLVLGSNHFGLTPSLWYPLVVPDFGEPALWGPDLRI